MSWTVWIPLLVSVIAAGSAFATAYFTLRAAHKQRILTRELKLADSHQQRINRLRECMANFASLSESYDFETDDALKILDQHRKMLETGIMIELLVEMKNPIRQKLMNSMSLFHAASKSRIWDRVKQAHLEYVACCHEVLGYEIERMENELRNIEK